MRSKWVFLLLVAFSSMLPLAARAGKGFSWLPVTEADWAVAEDSERDIKDAVIIFDKVTADDEDMLDKKCYCTEYRRVRILSTEGRTWADVLSNPIKKGFEVEEIRGRTILRDGSAFELDQKQILEKEVLAYEGLKLKQKAFTLPMVTADCIVEYFIKYRSNDPFNRWIIQDNIHLLAGEYVWEFCRGKGLAGYAYRTFADSLAPSYSVEGAGDQLKITRGPSEAEPTQIAFTIADVPALDTEPFCPPGKALKWQLRRYYRRAESGTQFWSRLAKEVADNLKVFLYYDFEVTNAIAKDLPWATASEDGERAACAWINGHVRNTDLDGEDPKAKGNGCVGHVVKHGYGNTMEITATFYQMLKDMKIDAKLAYATDRSEGSFVPEAKYWQFDRFLVAVPRSGGGYAFYQPGYDYLVPGQVMWGYEGTSAMVYRDSTVEFVQIPYSDSKTNRASSAVTLAMTEDLHLTGRVVESSKGHPAAIHRARLHNAQEGDRDQYLGDYVSESFPTFRPDSFSVEGLDNPWLPLFVRWNVDADFAGKQLGDRVLVSMSDVYTRQENPFVAPERKYDVVFAFARQSSDTLRIELPEGWTVPTVPNDTTFADQAGECRISFDITGRWLTVRRFFSLNKALWEVSAYPDVRQLFQARQTFGDIAVVVNRR